jgi:hypothetical protein
MSSVARPAGHGHISPPQCCRQCRIEVVATAVRQGAPELCDDDIYGAIAAVALSGAMLGHLARALAEHPEALALGAPPSVGALVAELRVRGSVLAVPACVRCGRCDAKLSSSAEGGVCPMCRRRQTACPCAVCSIIKPVAGRDSLGRALCAVCAPRPKRKCSRCGRVRIIARRAHDGVGELCDACFKNPLAKCRLCAKTKPCNFVADGAPICASCSPRAQALCAHCGVLAPPSVRWREGPVCERCYRGALDRRGVCAHCGVLRRLVDPPGPSAIRCAGCAGVAALATCVRCGVEERLYRKDLCVRCALAERAVEVLGRPDGPLGVVVAAIIVAPQPYSAHNWLAKATSAAIAADIASGALALTHEALDAHPARRAANYLRHILVAHGALAARDDGLVELVSWVEARLVACSAAWRTILSSYARWHVVLGVRRRAEASPRPRTPTARAKTCLNAAIAFMSFLDSRGVELCGTTQSDIDAWASQGPPSSPEVGDFINWAHQHRLIGELVIAPRRILDGPATDSDTRWAIVRRLLHDDTARLAERVAGCLVAIYGQQLSRIVSITTEQVSRHGQSTRLLLGATYIEVPEPLGAMLVELAISRPPKNSVLDLPATTWLFPGLDPGRALSASYLGGRLRLLGVPTMPTRKSALIHLAAQLPAAVLADLLGISPGTAVRWVAVAGGDWSTYAGQLVRQPDREP